MRTLYRGGAVYSPADPFATAVLVDGDTIGWVGQEEGADAVADAADRVVDLAGALVTPAFVDAHVHLTETGLALEGLDLTGVRSVAAVLDLVREAAERGRGRPVLGHGWDEALLAEGRPPTAGELDRAALGGVVYLSRVDVHSAVVSSSLAATSGARTRDGWDDSGRVERDAHHAVRRATRHGLGDTARRELQRLALDAAAAAGIAAVHEMGAEDIAPPEDLVLCAAEDPERPLVVPYWAARVDDADEAREVVASFARRGVRLAGIGGDLNVDGSLGSRTAALLADYADAPGHRGHLYLTAEQIGRQVVACTAVDLPTGFHVIGDAAAEAVLAGLEDAAARLGSRAVAGAWHRIEHAETLSPAMITRLAALGVTASVQPVFDARWGGAHGMYATRLGAERARALNPFAALAAAGVPLAFGSDSPVTPFDPWAAVRAAAFPHEPNHGISTRAAFAAHTRGPWRAIGHPERGVLRPGSEATLAVWEPSDLVVQAPDDRVQTWSTDPRAGTPALPDLAPGAVAPRCLATLRDGRTLYDTGLLAVSAPR